MEEIIDLEEVIEDVVDENLKEFMKKDEETEKLLNEKIDELVKEEEKLTKKEEEIKGLEDSSREKINSDASADELIEIAEKIKEAESELSSINENIEKLSKDKEELLETKNSIETSKREYIKSLNETSSEYDEQLKKIEEAIEVCDNPTLKQVLEDVQTKRNTELTELQEKRINELKTVLKEDEEEKPELEVSTEDNTVSPVLESNPIDIPVEPSIDEQPVSFDNFLNTINVDQPKEQSTLDIPVDTISYETPNNTPIIENELPSEEVKPIFTEEKNLDNMINLDSILTQSSPVTPDLNPVSTDNIIIPEVNPITEPTEEKVRIIYEKDVPNTVLKEVYSSSKIMPSLTNYLENKNEGSFI